jgi:two-component system response regulator AtoC
MSAQESGSISPAQPTTLEILIVDDDDAIVRTLQLHIAEAGHRVRTAKDLAQARKAWLTASPDAVILDQKLPDGNGIELLAEMRGLGDSTPVILITGHHEMESAVRAMKAGAYEFIHKPLDIDELDAVIGRVLRQRDASGKLIQTASVDAAGVRIAGRSRAILEIHKQIGRAAQSQVSVLITGETGTGKELVARAIHQYSSPAEPFIAINCSAIVPTLIEAELFGYERGAFTGARERREGKLFSTGRGTLFLDEIADLEMDLQAKLLRVLQERSYFRVGGQKELPFSGRVIAATNRDLHERIRRGEFREDLFYRLNVFAIHIPPLRDRKEDLPVLIGVLIEKIARELHSGVRRIAQEDLRRLTHYHWPGNVRELENVLTRSIIHSTGETLNLIFQPEAASQEAENADETLTLAEMERRHILSVLDRVGWHFGEACVRLGITRPTLRKKLREYGLHEKRFRGDS